MGEDDWQGWEELTAHLGRRLELAGDDLFVTNAERLREGIAAGVANSIVITPNQVGTLTETLEAVRVAQASNYATLIAQRSVAKYNRLLRIEEMLGPDAKFAGLSAFYPDRFEASA